MAVASERQCLILTPPGDDFVPVRDLVVKIIAESTTVPVFPVTKATALDSESIQRLIEKANMVVVDITGYDPNTMYELGVAHGLKKPVLLLVQKSGGSVPSDLRGVFFYVYHPGNIKEIEPIISHWMYGTIRDLHTGARL